MFGRRAAKNYRMWHKRDVDDVLIGPEHIPDHMIVVGHMIEIMYNSDKWGKKNYKFYDYVHDCESSAAVCCGHPDADIDTGLLINSRDWKRRLALSDLGECLEITFERLDGKTQNVELSGSILACTEDRRGLVIFGDGMDPIILRGGKMKVTKDGIIH
jgi:hypothetical protein